MNGYQFVFKPTALRDLQKLPQTLQKRIGQKLNFFRSQPNPLVFAMPLVGGGKVGQYRFRVGDWRVICDAKGQTITILMIEHRREVYRRR